MKAGRNSRRMGAGSRIASGESSTYDIHVRPFSTDASNDAWAKWLVSKGGGLHPRWRSNDRQLYYSTAGLDFMVVDIDTSQGFQAGAPKRLSATPPPLLNVGWDVAPNSKRFLFVTAAKLGPTAVYCGVELGSRLEEVISVVEWLKARELPGHCQGSFAPRTSIRSMAGALANSSGAFAMSAWAMAPFR
jgi:hypothetical protein